MQCEEVNIRDVLLGNATLSMTISKSLYDNHKYDEFDTEKSKGRPSWFVPMLVFWAFIVASALGLAWIRSSDARARGFYLDAPTAPDELHSPNRRTSGRRASNLNLSMLT